MTTTATETKGVTMKLRRKRTQRLVLGLVLGLATAAVVAAPAQAKPDDANGLAPLTATDDAQVSMRPDDQAVRVSPVAVEKLLAIPYLSHGVSVDESAFAGEPAAQTTIPYLSHGVGVDESAFRGEAAIPNVPDGRADRIFGATRSTPVVTDDGIEISWRDAGFGALATLLLVLLMGMTAILVRHGRDRDRLAAS